MPDQNLNAKQEGVKHDTGKLRMDLLPPDALAAVAAVLTFGAAKYADRNWELGMDRARLRAAAARHRVAAELGEEYDPETGLPHKAHEACCVLMELALALRGHGTDSASRQAPSAQLELTVLQGNLAKALHRLADKKNPTPEDDKRQLRTLEQALGKIAKRIGPVFVAAGLGAKQERALLEFLTALLGPGEITVDHPENAGGNLRQETPAGRARYERALSLAALARGEAEAKARTRGENLDGSPRRQTVAKEPLLPAEIVAEITRAGVAEVEFNAVLAEYPPGAIVWTGQIIERALQRRKEKALTQTATEATISARRQEAQAVKGVLATAIEETLRRERVRRGAHIAGVHDTDLA